MRRLLEKRVYGIPLSMLIPFVLTLLGVVSTILLLIQRNHWDSQYCDVVACLDYNAAYQLSQVAGEDLDSILAKLRSLGYVSIAVSEMTVLSATDKGYIFEANDDYLIELADRDKKVDDILEDLIVRRNFVMFGSERAEETKHRLKLAYGDNVIAIPVSSGLESENRDAGSAAVPMDTEPSEDLAVEDVSVSSAKVWMLFSIPREAEVDFNKVALGFDPDEWRRAREAGFDVVPRIVSCEKYDAADIAAVFDDIDRVSFETRTGSMPPDYRIVIFEGDTVPGYPGDVKSTAEQIKKRGIYFGWIEFEIQDGAGALASGVSPKVVLTHSISADEMIKQNVPQARSRFIRALKERNVRLIYIRPFFTGLRESGKGGSQAVSASKFNLDYYSKLAKMIADGGFTLAREPAAPPFEDWHPLKLFVVAGLIGFTVIFIRIVVKPPAWVEPSFWIIAIPASAGLYIISPRLLYQGYALLSATIAPVFAAVIALAIVARAKPRIPAGYIRTVAAYATALVVTALGGMAIYALVNSAGAFVKVEAFKGVMVSLAVPVLLIATYIWDIRTFMTAAGDRIPGLIERFNKLLDRKIEFVDMLIVFLGLAALALILLRSGNEAPIGVAQMELVFRERLEDLLSVRPRTKEIVGLPALFFFLAYFHNRKPPSIVLALLGSVALTSVVNTFCHLHTPIAISLVRALLGALLGIVAGSIAYGIYAGYLGAIRKLQH
jgi:hypothetical protein